MSVSDIFLDIGPHKTASTFRQRILYPRLPVEHHTLENNRSVLDLLLFSDYEDGKKHVVSCEDLSGWSYLPRFESLGNDKNGENQQKGCHTSINTKFCSSLVPLVSNRQNTLKKFKRLWQIDEIL